MDRGCMMRGCHICHFHDLTEMEFSPENNASSVSGCGCCVKCKWLLV